MDPGILQGSAYQCIPGNVYLRSDLPREYVNERDILDYNVWPANKSDHICQKT